MNETMLADWLRAARRLARRAELHELLRELDLEVVHYRRKAVQIVFVGGANCGKSSRINALLGRNVLPVSPTRSSIGLSILAGDTEQAIFDGQPKPLSDLASIRREPPGEVEIRLDEDWLRRGGCCLVERPPLDTPDGDLDSAIAAALSGADLVVHVIDALMPVHRVDAALLAACAHRGLPLIVALSKGDHLSEDERATVLELVDRHLAALGIEPPVIDAAAAGGEGLRQAFDATLAKLDLAGVRSRQLEGRLLDVLDALELAACAGLEAQAASSRQAVAEKQQREQRVEAQGLGWLRIEHHLEARRQEIDRQVRQELDTSRASTLEALEFELGKTDDVGRWWKQDLPYRLQRELQSALNHVASSVNRQVAGDLRWLRTELHRRFRSPQVSLAEPDVAVTADRLDPSTVELADMQGLRLVSRIGTAATMLLASIALAKLRLVGATMAVGSLSGLAADQIARRVAARDRTAVRAELDRLVRKAWLEGGTQVSARLKHGYDELLAAVGKERERWRDAQSQALRREPAAAAFDWKALLDQTQALAADISKKGN